MTHMAAPPVPLVVPPSKAADASSRAVRTFVGSLIAVALTAAGTALTAALAGGIRWTAAYWQAVGAAVGLAVVNAAVAYVLRHLATPPGSSTT